MNSNKLKIDHRRIIAIFKGLYENRYLFSFHRYVTLSKPIDDVNDEKGQKFLLSQVFAEKANRVVSYHEE